MTSTNFQNMTDADLAAIISAGAANLTERDQPFAASLVAGVARYGRATEKQRPYLVKMAERASGAATAAPERKKTAVGDLGPINALFDKARAHLKAPAIVIGFDGEEYRLSVAGERARAPGSINVTESRRAAGEGAEALWFGRIIASGEFEASPRAETPAGLIDGLRRFAADPAAVAAEHGRLTGRCCFCNRGLTDARSTAVGYGGTCAERYGLPWG